MFYRLAPREALALPGPEYLALCYRASAYQGAMAARAAALDEQQAQEKETVAPTQEAVEASPFAGMIDWG